MNAKTLEVMLRLNKTEDVVAIVLAQPPLAIAQTLKDVVEQHNAWPTLPSQQFLEAIIAIGPKVQAMTKGVELSSPRKYTFSR